MEEQIAEGHPSWVRSALFTIGQAASTVVFAMLGLFVLPLPFLWRYRFITQWTRFNLWWLSVACGVRYAVEGRENIPSGPAVVLCKHESAFETLALQFVFPPQVWLLKRELLWIPFFGWGLALLEPIAIDRKAGRQALRRLMEIGTRRLREGRWVVIFPEGTRVVPGERGRYAPGGALLAHHAGFPVVPVAHNAGDHWPKRGFLKRPGVIRIAVGPVIDTRGLPAQEINRRAEAWIEAKTAELHHGPVKQ